MLTTGRPTLSRTLESIKRQSPDRLILLMDGYSEEAGRQWKESRLSGEIICLDGPNNDWGKTARNYSLQYLHTTHAMYIDDDDSYMPDAVNRVRSIISQRPNRPILFRMRYKDGKILWGYPNISYGNVGTPMFVFPTRKYGRWEGHDEDGRGEDYRFIKSTCDLYSNGPLWCTGILAKVRH